MTHRENLRIALERLRTPLLHVTRQDPGAPAAPVNTGPIHTHRVAQEEQKKAIDIDTLLLNEVDPVVPSTSNRATLVAASNASKAQANSAQISAAAHMLQLRKCDRPLGSKGRLPCQKRGRKADKPSDQDIQA